MKSKHGEENSPHITRGSALDDLGFSSAEALEIKVKADIYRALLGYIHDRGYTQQQLSSALGIHQPDVSNLLTGRISKFSIGKLLIFAGKLNLGAQIKLTRPPASKVFNATEKAKNKKRELFFV